MKATIVLAGLAAATAVAGTFATALAGHRDLTPNPDIDAPTTIRGGGSDADEEERIDLGFAMAPVPLDLEGLNPRLVGLGSYLVNTGTCSDCHTNPPYAPGGDPFLGEPEQINTANYMAGGTQFGPFVSRNITPSPINGLPAGRSFAQFAAVMRTGFDFECASGDPPPCPLLQVMPWPIYQSMTEHELRAIYAYLSAIPHAEPAPPALHGDQP
jgi:hypothetical protein